MLYNQKEYFDEAFTKGAGYLKEDLSRGIFLRDEIIPAGVKTVLDVGCGPGEIAKIIQEKFQVEGVELSASGVARARENKIPCQQGNIISLPFADKSFDLVMACEVLEHLDFQTIDLAICELARVSQGYILITTPNRDNFKVLRQECPCCKSMTVPWGHIQRFDRQRLAGLFTEAGYEAVRIEAFGPAVPNHNHWFTRIAWLHWRFHYALRPNKRCVVCGYRNERNAQQQSVTGQTVKSPPFGVGRILDGLARRISPRCPRWLVALYRLKHDH